MPEETIFQDQNQTAQGSPTPILQTEDSPEKQSSKRSVFSKFFSKRLIVFVLFLISIPAVLFVILNIILPQFIKPTDREVTLSYWGIREDEEIISVISDFEKENPNIKVIYSKQDPTDYREKLSTRIENGTGPDIFKFHNSWFPLLANELLPLPQEVIDKKQFMDSFYEVSQRDLIRSGAIYGIPSEVDTLALFINTKIFSDASSELGTTIEPPSTWQDFIDSSVSLTKKDESGKIVIAGAALGTFENITNAPDIISLLFAQNGVDFDNLEAYEDKIADALTFYTNFSLIETNVWDSTLEPSINEFSQGKLAMFFGYARDYFEIKKKNPDLAFKIVAVPQLLASSNRNIASYWVGGVSAKSKNQKEALLFMKYLAKKETAQKLFEEQSKARSIGMPPGNKNIAQELRNTGINVFVDQANTAVSSAFVDGLPPNGLNDILNNILKDAVGEILDRGSAESAARSLLEGYSQVMSQFSPVPTE